MVYEKLIKRTIWVSKCKCGINEHKESGAPRERHCSCGQWVPYEEESVIGPDLTKGS